MRTSSRAESDPNESKLRKLSQDVWKLIHTDVRLALQRAREYLELAEQGGDESRKSSAMHAVGCCFMALGKMASAERWLARAAEHARGHDLLNAAAHAAITRIQALHSLGRTRDALDEARKLRQEESARNNALGTARALQVEANVYSRLHQSSRALPLLEQAKQLLQDKSEAEEQYATLEVNRANVLTVLGHAEEAQRAYEFAKSWSQSHEKPRLLCNATYNEACLHVMSGAWQKAYDLFEGVRPLFQEIGDQRGVVMVDLDEAELLLRLGLHDDVEQLASRAIDQARELKLAYAEGQALLVRGSARFQRSDREGAVEDYETAGERFRKSESLAWHALVQVALGFLHLAGGDANTALAHAQSARLQRQSTPLVTVQVRELEAQAALELGELDHALHASRAAARALTKAPAPWLREIVWCSRGRIHVRRGRYGEARRSFERAAQSVELSQGFVLSEPLGFSFLRGRLHVYDELVDLYLNQPPGNQRTIDNVEAAFDAVNRSRGAGVRSLGHRSIQGASSDPVSTPDTEHTIGALAVRLQSLYARLTPGQEGRTHLTAAHRQELQQSMQQREDELLQRLRQSPRHRTMFPPSSSASVQWASKQVGARGILIEYFAVKGQLGAFVLTRGKLRVFPGLVDLRFLEKTVRKLQFQLDRGVLATAARTSEPVSNPGIDRCRAIVDQLLAHLASIVLEPILTRHTCVRETSEDDIPLFVVPHGCLQAVPFSALPLPWLDEAAGADEQNPTLLDLGDLAILPGRELLAQGPSPVPTRSGRVLAFGTPRAELPEIERELDALAQHLPDTVIHRGPDATLQNFRSLAPVADVLHLACHATFRSDNPFYSSLELSDGWLPAWELTRLNIPARLTVLSACESGRFHTTAGDDAIGIARAFFAAGSQNLLVSHGRVRDEVAAFRSAQFYQAFASDLKIRTAHRRAMIEVRARYPDPWDWGSSVLLGRGEETLAP